MLNYEFLKSFKANDIFFAVYQKFHENVEGQFNEIYCPPCEGAILFWIPETDEEWNEREVCEKYVADILMNKGGLSKGEHCYIHFDY